VNCESWAANKIYETKNFSFVKLPVVSTVGQGITLFEPSDGKAEPKWTQLEVLLSQLSDARRFTF
jgi:hypothetical protein